MCKAVRVRDDEKERNRFGLSKKKERSSIGNDVQGEGVVEY